MYLEGWRELRRGRRHRSCTSQGREQRSKSGLEVVERVGGWVGLLGGWGESWRVVRWLL